MNEKFTLIGSIDGNLIRPLKQEEIYNLHKPLYLTWCRYCGAFMGYAQTEESAKENTGICVSCRRKVYLPQPSHPLYTFEKNHLCDLLICGEEEKEMFVQRNNKDIKKQIVRIPWIKSIKGIETVGKSKEILDQLYFE